MAKESNNRMSQVCFSKGSDAELNTPCSPCLEDEGKSFQSVVFCLECYEHLCTTCRKHHRSLKLTRGHHLIEIGRRNPSMIETCPEHPGKSIEFYCEKDQSLCCKTCRDISHGGCDGVKCIQDEANCFREGPEVNNTEEALKNLSSRLSCHFYAKRKLPEHISNQVADALIQVDTNRRTTIKRVNELADEAKEDITAKCSDVNNQIKNEIQTMESMLDTLNATEKCMSAVKQSDNESQIYITVKRAYYQLKKYSAYADDVTANLLQPNVQFQLDSTFNSIKTLNSMGIVLTDQDQPTESTKNSSRSQLGSKPKKAIPVGGHSVRIPGDKTTCCITGSEILHDGRIVLADYNNRNLNLFNKRCTYVNHLALSSRPTDIVVLGENKIATSLIDEKGIQVVTVSSLLCLSRFLKTTNPYFGLTFDENKLLFGTTTAEEGKGEVHVMDMTGKILGSIKKINEQTDLIRPTAIRLDNKNQLLYINDVGRNNLFCLDISRGVMNFRQVFLYTDRNLELRNGLALDIDGNVYVSSGNMTVHQIFNGRKVHEILTSADGLGRPQCLAFSSDQNILYVSEFKENSFKLYALK